MHVPSPGRTLLLRRPIRSPRGPGHDGRPRYDDRAGQLSSDLIFDLALVRCDRSHERDGDQRFRRDGHLKKFRLRRRSRLWRRRRGRAATRCRCRGLVGGARWRSTRPRTRRRKSRHERQDENRPRDHVGPHILRLVWLWALGFRLWGWAPRLLLDGSHESRSHKAARIPARRFTGH